MSTRAEQRHTEKVVRVGRFWISNGGMAEIVPLRRLNLKLFRHLPVNTDFLSNFFSSLTTVIDLPARTPFHNLVILVWVDGCLSAMRAQCIIVHAMLPFIHCLMPVGMCGLQSR
jgi:hypothetical protein